jgi:hypothetical protein
MAVSPETARILNPQSQVNVTGTDPLRPKAQGGTRLDLRAFFHVQ